MSAVTDIINKISANILNPFIILLFGVALLVFFWGLFQFLLHTDSEEARETGKKTIMWGLIGMTIMISVFGITRLVIRTFGLDSAKGGESIPTYLK